MNKGSGPTGMLPAGAVVAFHLNRVKPLNPHSPRKSLKNTSQKLCRALQSVSLTWATMVPSVEIFARSSLSCLKMR
jgi:hypothetical protein